MTLLFLVGVFLGSAIGFFAHALLSSRRKDEIMEACERCHKKHMDALLRAGVDTRWETERR